MQQDGRIALLDARLPPGPPPKAAAFAVRTRDNSTDGFGSKSGLSNSPLLPSGTAGAGTLAEPSVAAVVGGSVKTMLSRSYPRGLPLAAVRRYTRQLLAGLHFLHEAMVIHSDLKGDNLLVCLPGAVPSRAMEADAHADPNEVVVTGKGKHDIKHDRLSIGADQLNRCSSIVFDKPAKQIRLSCL